MKVSKMFVALTLLPLLSSCQNQESSVLSTPQSQAVLGGVTAAPNEFPFVVNIWLNSPRDNYVDHLCGASLIHPKWVLTAAHCMLDDTSESVQRPLKTNLLNLYIGSDKISGDGGRRLKAKSIFIHPDFSWPHHDVALIELETPVTDIAPVILNDQDLDNSAANLNATVIGWGLTDQVGKIDGAFLQKLSLPLTSRKACNTDSFPSKKGWTMSSDILCAITNQNQKASCPGDSGGPLLLNENGRYKQVGIVSWGSACSGNPPRYQSNIEGHASVADALPWIQKVISGR